jgi:hypothetical protein
MVHEQSGSSFLQSHTSRTIAADGSPLEKYQKELKRERDVCRTCTTTKIPKSGNRISDQELLDHFLFSAHRGQDWNSLTLHSGSKFLGKTSFPLTMLRQMTTWSIP